MERRSGKLVVATGRELIGRDCTRYIVFSRHEWRDPNIPVCILNPLDTDRQDRKGQYKRDLHRISVLLRALLLCFAFRSFRTTRACLGRIPGPPNITFGSLL